MEPVYLLRRPASCASAVGGILSAKRDIPPLSVLHGLQCLYRVSRATRGHLHVSFMPQMEVERGLLVFGGGDLHVQRLSCLGHQHADNF